MNEPPNIPSSFPFPVMIAPTNHATCYFPSDYSPSAIFCEQLAFEWRLLSDYNCVCLTLLKNSARTMLSHRFALPCFKFAISSVPFNDLQIVELQTGEVIYVLMVLTMRDYQL